MRGPNETDIEYWNRRMLEALAVAEKSHGELRQAHLALAESYARLIEITSGVVAEDADEVR